MSGISAQYVDGLEFRIKELREQVEKLTKERDEWKESATLTKKLLDAEDEQLAALAEQNEKQRKALIIEGDYQQDNDGGVAPWIRQATSLPNLATPVLNKYRAEGMRVAADYMQEKHQRPEFLWDEIRARADELEKSQ